MHGHGKDPKCSNGKWEDTGAGSSPPLDATVGSSARPPVLEQGAPKIPDSPIPCGTLRPSWACFSLGTMDSLGVRDVHDGDVQDGEVQDGDVQDRDTHTVLGSDLASWLCVWEFFHLIMLFWAICLKAMDTAVFQPDPPCPGVPQSRAHPRAHPKAPGPAQHPDPACSAAVSAVESTPCNKEGISGKQWQIRRAGCAKRL